MRTGYGHPNSSGPFDYVGMKPLSGEMRTFLVPYREPKTRPRVGMKPLSERDENSTAPVFRGAIFIW